MPYAVLQTTVLSCACSAGRDLLLKILTKKTVHAAHWLPEMTTACMDKLAGSKQLQSNVVWSVVLCCLLPVAVVV